MSTAAGTSPVPCTSVACPSAPMPLPPDDQAAVYPPDLPVAVEDVAAEERPVAVIVKRSAFHTSLYGSIPAEARGQRR
jgi:hypothetical protein